MTRYSTALTLATLLGVALTSPQSAFSQAAGDDLVQQGDYGYASPWNAAVPPPTTVGSGQASEFQPEHTAFQPEYTAQANDGLARLPVINNSAPLRQVTLLSDIVAGYPPVITERGQVADQMQQPGASWTNQSISARPAPTMTTGGSCADGSCESGAGSAAGAAETVGEMAAGETALGMTPANYGRPGYDSFGGTDINGPFGTTWGNSPGLFFSYDALYTWLSSPDVGAIGSANAAGIYTTNSLPNPFYNTVSTDFIDSDGQFGHRFEFGCINDCGGWLFSVLTLNQDNMFTAAGGQIQFNDPLGMLLGYQDANGDDIDDDLNGNHVHGRDGEDLGVPNPLFNPPVNTERYLLGPDGITPIYDGDPDTSAYVDTGDLITFIPLFDSLAVRNRIDIDGFEFNYAHAGRGSYPGRRGITSMLGVRVLDIDDDFWIDATGSFLDTNIRAEIDNLIVGPTLGWSVCHRIRSWRFDALFKTTFGVNFMRGEQVGELATDAGTGTTRHNQPVNLSPSAFANFKEEQKFAPVLEWRVGAAYELTKSSAIRLGYTGMYIDGLSRAASATEYTLPSFGLGLNGDDKLNFNALLIGIELYR